MGTGTTGTVGDGDELLSPCSSLAHSICPAQDKQTTSATVTNRLIVETVGERQYSVGDVEVERRACPARRDGVGQPPRGRRPVTDDADERLDSSDDDPRRHVLSHVEHVERLRELEQQLMTTVFRLIQGDVEVDAGAVRTVARSDAQRIHGRRHRRAV